MSAPSAAELEERVLVVPPTPKDARLFYERDQLAKRTGVAPASRLREFERHRRLVDQRDDLSVEYCALLNLAGRHEEARVILAARRFQPWEGGEGLVSGEFVRTHLALGRQALAAGDAARALRSAVSRRAASARCSPRAAARCS